MTSNISISPFIFQRCFQQAPGYRVRHTLPVRIELDTNPEKFAEISLMKHKSVDTEDYVNVVWYNQKLPHRGDKCGS